MPSRCAGNSALRCASGAPERQWCRADRSIAHVLPPCALPCPCVCIFLLPLAGGWVSAPAPGIASCLLSLALGHACTTHNVQHDEVSK